MSEVIDLLNKQKPDQVQVNIVAHKKAPRILEPELSAYTSASYA